MRQAPLAIAAIALSVAAVQGGADVAEPWRAQGTATGEEIIGPDGSKMVWVPAGEFAMGSEDGPAGEQPVHRVKISKGFWISRTPVTIAQWRRYCRDSGTPLTVDIMSPTDDYPIWGVNWEDVEGYCRHYGLALPTEAQWEYAARGPEARVYPWGNQWDKALCCNNDNNGPDGFTCPVGSYPDGASWCGALDMAGNLSAWCADWYSETYYADSPETDPCGPDTGTERVQRGGYFWSDADGCRSANRSSDDPANRDGSGSLRPCFTP